ncbi:MAG: hypothetical protein K2P68_03150 [Sphingomonas sp.]|nr:hypothetical protein [Sphingomonas sp.]
MQFLKTLFWALLVVIVTVFAIGNWTPVPIRLWGGLIADVNLPILLVLTFLSGMFPVLLYHHAVKWRLKSRLTTAERTIADLRNIAHPAAPSGTGHGPADDLTIPPASVPTAVPPGVA